MSIDALVPSGLRTVRSLLGTVFTVMSLARSCAVIDQWTWASCVAHGYAGREAHGWRSRQLCHSVWTLRCHRYKVDDGEGLSSGLQILVC